MLCGQIPLSRALYLLPVTTASPDKTSIDLPILVLPLSTDHKFRVRFPYRHALRTAWRSLGLRVGRVRYIERLRENILKCPHWYVLRLSPEGFLNRVAVANGLSTSNASSSTKE